MPVICMNIKWNHGGLLSGHHYEFSTLRPHKVVFLGFEIADELQYTRYPRCLPYVPNLRCDIGIVAISVWPNTICVRCVRPAYVGIC